MSSTIDGAAGAEAVAAWPPPKRRLSIGDQLALSSFWFATNLHWGALLLIIIPHQAKVISPDNPVRAMQWIFFFGAFVALLVPLIAGAMSDRSTSRYGRRRPFMVFGVAVNLVGLAIMGIAVAQRNLVLYIAGILIVQFGNNTAGAAYAGVIPDLVPVSQHGEASGYMATMTQAGTIVAAIGAGFLMDKELHTLAFVIIGCVMVVFLALTVFTVHETPLATKPAPLTMSAFMKGLIEPLKSRDFLWVLVTRALVTLGMWCVQPYIQNYLSDVVHVENEAKMGGILFAVILVCATVTGLLGGMLSDVIGRKKVVYAANTLIAICSIAFVFSHSLLYTFIVGAIYGIGYGAYFSVDWALACDVLPNPEDSGKDMGIWHVSMVLPQIFAPLIAGYVLDNVGHSMLVGGVRHYSIYGYQTAFTMAAVFLMLAVFFLRNVRDRHEREKQAAQQQSAQS